ncbi:Bifunctional uridylyltransferase/uridylyl-removing enzyme [Pirellulimonas nuda]|uniref:Bifunctional uridylyltransferase/uridylyl-removing enzyme n=1 Tax=Pirellulimonas nuda TaxID=2528009 RepID=A0A518D6D2_9BACT|nr:[protein-PII] uridylyltransferase [Pirellulimonas nuda]QDU87019.1 Bifunctional uridylyltransferase/uridylyl-removing enzyme [Pirellulimonas nuda]
MPSGDSKPGVPRLRSELLEVRDALEAARQQFRHGHDLGADAVRLCGRFTGHVDTALTRLFESAVADAPAGEAAAIRAGCVLAPIGGYGRRQLAPYSDIDLMILHAGGAAAGAAKNLARRLTQDIFDAGMALGQSLRTVEEALSLSKQDAVIASSLVEARQLIGSAEVYQKFRTQFEASVRRRARYFCGMFVEARREERLKYGETIYLLEPNIKRSRGALRDIHLLRWLWYTQHGVSDFDRLQSMGVVSMFDYRRLTSARDFLMRVRNDLHLEAGKARDDLARAEQLRMAEKMGYRGRDGLRPVEQFMRDYFRHASHVWFLAARVSELTQPKPTVDRVLGPVVGRYLDHDYRVGVRDIHATGDGRAKLTSRVEEVLRLVDLARLYQKRIGAETWYLVYRASPTFTTELSPDAAARFLAILDNPTGLGELLRRMHDLGVLEKVVPEFTHARCLLQFNQYHKYTVDEHCIRAVQEAAAFETREDGLGAVYRALPQKRLLHLALVIHDLAKGRDGDHSVLGAELARQNARRLGLSEADGETLAWLVLKHLEMALVAFRRNTGDPQTVAAFAQDAATPERLTLLYLITCADFAAVGPGVLNAWKVEVLSDLHRRALAVLQPERTPSDDERRGAVRGQVWARLSEPERDDPWFAQQFAALPESFVTGRPAGDVADTLQRLKRLSDGRGDAWGVSRPETGTTELLAGVDRGSGRGVFSAMAGALSASGMQILAAETASLADQMLLLRYVVEDRGPSGDPGRVAQAAAKMVAAIDSDKAPKFPRIWGVEQQHTDARLSDLPTEVRLNASVSQEHLIVEVFTLDRRGLLYHLARALHDLELVIAVAKIGTYLDQVVDVFYVAERDGGKPAGEERFEAIRARLIEVIDAS